MKQYIIAFVLVLAAAGLFAQTGLFHLAYDMPLLQADSMLVRMGFMPSRPESASMVHYHSVRNPKVEDISLIVNPETVRLVGWMIKYNPSNTEEEDNRVFNSLIEMHRDWFRNYSETGQIVWLLDEGKTVHLIYLENGQLSVLYYDSDYDSLFHPPDYEPGNSPDSPNPETE